MAQTGLTLTTPKRDPAGLNNHSWPDQLDRPANFVLATEGNDWRMNISDGAARVRHFTYCPEQTGHAQRRGVCDAITTNS
jgi:hypothetical protein